MFYLLGLEYRRIHTLTQAEHIFNKCYVGLTSMLRAEGEVLLHFGDARRWSANEVPKANAKHGQVLKVRFEVEKPRSCNAE